MFPRVTNPSAAPHRSEALDLHVLGLPPAFVLSQDQTLKLKSNCLLILDVRTSAHRPTMLRLGNIIEQFFLFVVLQVFIRKQETVQTVKLTLDNRVETLPALIYRRLIHRMNQTAHISLQILSISKSKRQNQPTALISLARPASFTSVFLVLRLVALWPVWRPVGASLRRW
jgi:hypothetical protein